MSNYHNLLASADRIKKLAESFLQDFDWRVFVQFERAHRFLFKYFPRDSIKALEIAT